MDAQSLIQDLAVIMVLVAVVSSVFTRLGWPKVIGYILAGTLAGKYTLGGSFIVNERSIDVLGQLGVIFLMFSLGMAFNIGKLRKVSRVAAPTALLDMVVMVWAGHFIGVRVLGWGSVQSLFLGAAISDSATTLLAKTINDMGWGMRRFTKYIFGITIMEDIFCIGLIAILTGFAGSGTFKLAAFAQSVGGLLLFLMGVTVIGILLVPRCVNAVSRLKDDDALLLLVLGLCFLLSLIAEKLHFGLALGAFLMGVLVAETEPLKRIERQCNPLRILFSAIFFVTIGMMVDPHALKLLWPQILGITLLVVVGKSVNCTVGALLTGQDLKNAIQTGVGLAQIGEFAYLVALIGISLKVVGSELYQIAIGVSVLTTLLNPFLMRASDPLADWVVARTPKGWLNLLDTYHRWVERFQHAPTPPEQIRQLRFNFWLILINLMLVAVHYLAAGLLAQLNYSVVNDWVELHKKTLLWVAANILSVPCCVLVFYRARKLADTMAAIMIPERVCGTGWAEAFKRVLQTLSSSFWIAILFFEVAMLSGSIMPESISDRLIMGVVLLVLAVLTFKRIRRFGSASLAKLRDTMANDQESVSNESAAEILDIHTERIRIPLFARVDGLSLKELHLRNRTGASVIGIDRGGRFIVNPTADETLRASDQVMLLGDETQLSAARAIFTEV
ncbi:MAG: cation:proton antiporter [Kiritimatiellae bacterium]|nr:cation:proton antiporter [Kiritimatiellia bacterium]